VQKTFDDLLFAQNLAKIFSFQFCPFFHIKEGAYGDKIPKNNKHIRALLIKEALT